MSVSAATRRYWANRLVLYRFFDETGRLIYIGRTKDLPGRIAEHRRQSWWWAMVARARIQVFADEWDQEDAERAALRSERPAFNNRYAHGYSTRHYRRSDHARRELWIRNRRSSSERAS